MNEESKYRVPEKYHKIANLCTSIHNQLSALSTDERFQKISTHFIQIKDSDENKITELANSGDHILDWLKENNYCEDLNTFLTKHLTFSILSDFLDFISTSLENAAKGKMTVAYALLRKPFNDELLIFEQMMIDHNEFIERFFHVGKPIDYDPSNKDVDRRRIIIQSVEKIGSVFLNFSEIIHDLRYNKESKAGINWLTNHALHIVTRDKHYSTANQNFNFIFSQEEDFEKYFEHYYNFVPLLLLYSSSVIDEIIFHFMSNKEDETFRNLRRFQRFIAFFLIQDYLDPDDKLINNDVFELLGNNIQYECEKCEHLNTFKKIDFEYFHSNGNFICNNCKEDIILYNDDFEVIKPIVDINI